MLDEPIVKHAEITKFADGVFCDMSNDASSTGERRVRFSHRTLREPSNQPLWIGSDFLTNIPLQPFSLLGYVLVAD